MTDRNRQAGPPRIPDGRTPAEPRSPLDFPGVAAGQRCPLRPRSRRRPSTRSVNPVADPLRTPVGDRPHRATGGRKPMSDSRRLLHGRSRSTALIAAGGLLAGSTVIGLLPTLAGASSHREAPLIAADPAVDNTDVYAFSSPENPDNVVFVANWIPFEEPDGGPNFYPWADDAEYLINVDNDGDALADLVYRWRFTTDDRRGQDTFLYNNGPVDSLDDENLLFRQSFTLDVSTDGGGSYGAPIAEGPVAPSYTGPASMGSSQDYVDNLRTPAITDVQ